MSGNEEYQAVVAEIQKKQEQLDGLTNNSEEKAAVQAERMSPKRNLQESKQKLRWQNRQFRNRQKRSNK